MNNKNAETWSSTEWSIRTKAKAVQTSDAAKTKERSNNSDKTQKKQEEDHDYHNYGEQNYDENKQNTQEKDSSDNLEDHSRDGWRGTYEEETVVYTLPPEAVNKDKAQEAIFVQLFYAGRVGNDMEIISCGMIYFVQTFLNTTYP